MDIFEVIALGKKFRRSDWGMEQLDTAYLEVGTNNLREQRFYITGFDPRNLDLSVEYRLTYEDAISQHWEVFEEPK